MISWESLRSYLPLLLQGAWITLIVTTLSMLFGSGIGLAAGLMRVSRQTALRQTVAGYINLIRGTPLLIQILFTYFGLPFLLGVRVPAIVAGTVSMSVFTGAYMAEIVRTGIQAIGAGQAEAGYALGLSNWRTMRLVILPQAIWRMLPAIANQVSITLKDTSLLSVIGVAELTMAGQTIYSVNFDTIPVLTLVALIYLLIFWVADAMARLVERRSHWLQPRSASHARRPTV